MPLSRQADMLAGQGIRLDRATLGKWVKKTAWWLKGLYQLQLETIHGYARVFCDETRLPVRKKDRRRTHNGQFWAHVVDDRPWGGPAAPAVVYVFAQGRGHKEISAQLASYQGLLQVDGYGGYKRLAKPGRKPGPITLAFCLAHARRKFVDVYKVTKSTFAAEILGIFSRVYAIEAQVRGQSAENRAAHRQEKTVPVMAELKQRLECELPGLSSKSALAKAIRYTLAHWTGLTRFLADGRLEPDTNTVERTMRPVALGRRNYLYAGDDEPASYCSSRHLPIKSADFVGRYQVPAASSDARRRESARRLGRGRFYGSSRARPCRFASRAKRLSLLNAARLKG
jgi:transposase